MAACFLNLARASARATLVRWVVHRVRRRAKVHGYFFLPVDALCDLAGDSDRIGIACRQLVGHTADSGVYVAAAKLLRRHHLAGRGLYQWGAAEEDGPLLL